MDNEKKCIYFDSCLDNSYSVCLLADQVEKQATDGAVDDKGWDQKRWANFINRIKKSGGVCSVGREGEYNASLSVKPQFKA